MTDATMKISDVAVRTSERALPIVCAICRLILIHGTGLISWVARVELVCKGCGHTQVLR